MLIEMKPCLSLETLNQVACLDRVQWVWLEASSSLPMEPWLDASNLILNRWARLRKWAYLSCARAGGCKVWAGSVLARLFGMGFLEFLSAPGPSAWDVPWKAGSLRGPFRPQIPERRLVPFFGLDCGMASRKLALAPHLYLCAVRPPGPKICQQRGL